jgi:hypothetical protein
MAAHRGPDNLDSLGDKIADEREDLSRRLTLNGFNVDERYRHGDLYVMVCFKRLGVEFEPIFGAVPNFAGWEATLPGEIATRRNAAPTAMSAGAGPT